jgi:hypothetical protein
MKKFYCQYCNTTTDVKDEPRHYGNYIGLEGMHKRIYFHPNSYSIFYGQQIKYQNKLSQIKFTQNTYICDDCLCELIITDHVWRNKFAK